jgi:hypothetical protein
VAADRYDAIVVGGGHVVKFSDGVVPTALDKTLPPEGAHRHRRPPQNRPRQPHQPHTPAARPGRP